ncbi:MAG: metallophosphoesterase [Anaerostipes sp.]|nr:metallophosphoesterase [Anaerostipes sp.]
MLVLFIMIPMILMIPAIYYFYRVLRRVSRLFLKEETKKTKRICGVLGIVIMLLSWPMYGFRGMIILHFLCISLIFDLCNFILQKLWLHGKYKTWNILYQSEVLVIFLTGVIMIFGLWNMHQVTRKDYTIYTKDMKKERTPKIALVSDLHLGTTMDAAKMQTYADDIEKTNPDLVLLAGDIVDENTSKAEMEKIAKIFGNMKSTYGTYYVFGNHDYNTYVKDPNYTAAQLEKTFEAAGIHVLTDEIVNVSKEIVIVGQRDLSDSTRKDITKEIQGIPKDKFVILMDHQPGDIKSNSKNGIDLQVSGHTHAGQIWPTGQLMEILGVNQINYGYRKIGSYQVIVSSGIAGWGYPIRTGGRCEYVIIDCRRF